MNPSSAASQVFCPHCRGGNPPAAPFCMWCRAQLPPPPPVWLPPPVAPPSGYFSPAPLIALPGASPPAAYPLPAKRLSRGLQGALLAASILLFLCGTILGAFEGTIRGGQIIARRYYFGESVAALGTLLLDAGVGVFILFVGLALLQGREPPRSLLGWASLSS